MSLTFPAAIIKNNLLFDLSATTGKEASRDLSTYHLSGTFINFTDTPPLATLLWFSHWNSQMIELVKLFQQTLVILFDFYFTKVNV